MIADLVIIFLEGMNIDLFFFRRIIDLVYLFWIVLT
jgi:hypothetical protein